MTTSLSFEQLARVARRALDGYRELLVKVGMRETLHPIMHFILPGPREAILNLSIDMADNAAVEMIRQAVQHAGAQGVIYLHEAWSAPGRRDVPLHLQTPPSQSEGREEILLVVAGTPERDGTLMQAFDRTTTGFTFREVEDTLLSPEARIQGRMSHWFSPRGLTKLTFTERRKVETSARKLADQIRRGAHRLAPEFYA